MFGAFYFAQTYFAGAVNYAAAAVAKAKQGILPPWIKDLHDTDNLSAILIEEDDVEVMEIIALWQSSRQR